ncbi:MAG: hypothetical protein L3J08_02160 [Flavobacteriaceae bacterium]|nr:hypothetical protein [Flavobacteriaceae bacterium]
MIKYLLHNEIDFVKYDQCIFESKNSLIYGYSWYLNCVAPNWDVIVLNNYEAVMPLPNRKKYGINYIFQPSWVQQLGVFSKDIIDKNLINNFLNAIPKKFKLIDINFNSENRFKHKNLSPKDNFILNLNNSYKKIRLNFSQGRKSNINQAKRFELKIEEYNEIDSLIEVFVNNKGKEIGNLIFNFESLKTLVHSLQLANKVKILYVKSQKDELLGGAIFIFDKNRITYLFSALKKEGRKKQAMSFLINYIIESNTNSKLIFDFEGSVINEIAQFFKSFGATKEVYYNFNHKRFI